jgi:hypothetical protein
MDTPGKLNSTIPESRRGEIKGKAPVRQERIGGTMTNKQYGIDNNCSTRQASKKRRGY